MSTSRWLTWTPQRTTEIIEKSLEPRPSKPPKPGFEGFEGSSLGSFSIMEAKEPEIVPLPVAYFQQHDGSGLGSLQQRRGKPDPLWGDPCACGAREWRKLAGPRLECKACGCVVRSEYLAKGGNR
jgi:hypothetical protein